MLEGFTVEYLDAESIKVSLPEVDWSHRRKAVPLNIILPSTSVWAEDLLPQVRPLALMRTFPRIANLLASSWKDPKAFHKCIESLLVDRRGGRQGFSPEIRQELFRLRTAYRFLGPERTAGVAGSGVDPQEPET
jgi:hypothetical protein